MKTFQEFLNESLRIKSDKVLQDCINYVCDYLKNKEEFCKDYDNAETRVSETNLSPIIASFNEKEGHDITINVLYKKNYKQGDFRGFYIQEFEPHTMLLFVDKDMLYKNDNFNVSYFNELKNTMEHELTHYLQDISDYREDAKHNYVVFDSSNTCYETYCMNFVLYQLFNDIEAEAFLTSSSYEESLEIMNSIKEAFLISMICAYLWMKKNNFNCKFNGKLEKTIQDNLNTGVEDYLFKEKTLEESIQYLCEEITKHYRKSFEHGEEYKYVNLFVREGQKRYKKFISKMLKNIKKYCPELKLEAE